MCDYRYIIKRNITKVKILAILIYLLDLDIFLNVLFGIY